MQARASLLIVALAAGCQRGAPATGPAPPPKEAPDAGVTSTEPERTPIPDHPAGECKVDGDCALLPPTTWCGECPPAPPFDAVTRTELDAALIEAEEACGSEPEPATATPCPPAPAGCTARAACVDTRCAPISHGC